MDWRGEMGGRWEENRITDSNKYQLFKPDKESHGVVRPSPSEFQGLKEL